MKNLKKVVISGPNLVDGGPISVFYDFLDAIVTDRYFEQFDFILLVSQRRLFEKYSDFATIIEFPKSKSNWIYRLYYEYVYFNILSKRIKPYIWISMHDITPRVQTQILYTYCHNPSPFNHMSLKDAKYGFKYYLFSKFYKYLYAINIHKANAIIVQQDWMRQEFIKMYNLSSVIVARPSFTIDRLPASVNEQKDDQVVFVAPSFPRYYKNFEICCLAASILYDKGIENFKLYITLTGNENKYARYLRQKFSAIPTIDFCGLLDRSSLFQLYANSNCLLFMSKLETWGMPITEYKSTCKSMIVADLPYAHETVGDYDKVCFCDPDNAMGVAMAMKELICNGFIKGRSKAPRVQPPFAKNWSCLCDLLFGRKYGQDEK